MKYIITILISVLFLSCNNKKESTTNSKDVFYTCSMHPQVIMDKPGKCPVCAMDLIAVNKTTGDSSNEIKLSDQQMQLGNIILDTIKIGHTENSMVLPATLNIDQNKTNTVSSRISGRIQKLYYKTTGEYIPKNAKIFDLYSEQLNNAKQEYLMALERKQSFDNSIINFSELVSNAKNKLLLWGMSEGSVREMGRTKKFSTTTPFYNTHEGYITSFNVTEGDYISEGGSILNVAELGTIWAEVQLYSSQLPGINKKARVSVNITDLPGVTIEGKIDFLNPEVNSGTRINLLRVMIPNRNHLLKPGMAASVIFQNAQQNGVYLPSEAIIRNNAGASIWIRTGNNTFKNRMVNIGKESDDKVEIKSGLAPGEVVVIGGAYLLNSEYIFKKGASPMEGMDMSKMKM